MIWQIQNYLVRQVEKRPITVVLGKTATAEDVLGGRFDAVIVAVGL